MDLVSLQSVKNWLNVQTTNDDVVLTRLIQQVSGAVLNYLQRPKLTRNTYVELRDGVGNQRMVLRNWPVVNIASLVINGINIPAATGVGAVGGNPSGYTLETWDGTSAGLPQSLTLCGYAFNRGKNNVAITYDAGYAVTAQPFTVPGNPYKLTVTPEFGAYSEDDGLAYAATGAALTAVASNVAPAVGQYSVVIDPEGTGTYSFNSADSAVAMLISYSYVPAALEQGTMEWIGERYRYRERIGLKSNSVGGNETASYDTSGMPKYVAEVLDGYKKFLPV